MSASALSPPLERLGQRLARQRQPLTLGGKRLALLGDVLALPGNPLALQSHPNKLAVLVRRPRRLASGGDILLARPIVAVCSLRCRWHDSQIGSLLARAGLLVSFIGNSLEMRDAQLYAREQSLSRRESAAQGREPEDRERAQQRRELCS